MVVEALVQFVLDMAVPPDVCPKPEKTWRFTVAAGYPVKAVCEAIEVPKEVL